MYGTVARLRLKDGVEGELQRLMRLAGTLRVAGFVAEYIYRLDADPRVCYLVVLFDSRDAYQRNAVSPEQHARYEDLRRLLDADPEWHDGEITVALPPQ